MTKIHSKILSLLALLLVIATVTACKKKDDPNSPAGCSGPAQMTLTGAVNGDYCLKEVTQYKYNDRLEISIVTSNGAESQMLFISIDGQNGQPPLTGSFLCGGDNPGFVQAGFHGANEEFFNATSGSVTVSQISANNFKASFSVSAKGYYDGQVVTLTGTVNY
ncbi:MAG: hypothetical protein KGZ82_02750 [Bacteroidales bacterium]|nr:hypothetical protein [Bacteroidales bacterium]